MKEKLVKGKIENWVVVEQDDQIVLVGEMGFRFFKSSEIINLTPTQVETANSIYDLGKPRFSHHDIYNMGKKV